jgi:hypothetical protein
MNSARRNWWQAEAKLAAIRRETSARLCQGYGAGVFAARKLRAKTGGKGIRTPDLLIANETLYQLSYTPPKLRASC